MNVQEQVTKQAEAAKAASRQTAKALSSLKNAALESIARAFIDRTREIQRENARDLDYARDKGLSAARVDRLTLTPERIAAMARAVGEIAELPDPVGQVTGMWRRPNGMQVGRLRVPLGVVGVIYESRPNVTADAAALCLKSGNAVVLRGGSEAINSNRVLAAIIGEALEGAGLPSAAVQFIDTPERGAVYEMLKLHGLIDLIVPRGSKEMVLDIVAASTIPVVRHDEGVCHTYVEASADLGMALEICLNAKVQRPGVCNAMETLLVDAAAAPEFLPRAAEALAAEGVELRGCPRSRELCPSMKEAVEADWSAEYLDLILSVKVVDSLDEAVAFINRYGSAHTDAIITNDYAKAQQFLREVDSASVMVNASVRLADGGEYGLGAEVGISNQKLHSRGPMGLEDLTSLKYIVYGDGQIRE